MEDLYQQLPLLLGRLAKKALLEKGAVTKNGLYAGRAGIALFLAYYSRYTGEEGWLDNSMALLQDAFESIDEEEAAYNLSSGLAGTAWTLTHLARHGFLEAELEELLSDVDGLLLDTAVQAIAEGQYDLLHSGLGVGVYFLERQLEAAAAGRTNRQAGWALEKIITALAEARVPDSGFHSWPDTFSRNRREGSFNLGLAHGVPSIISFLAGCLSAGVPYERLSKLLAESMEWLRRQELPEGSPACFANTAGGTAPSQPNSRLAWCYGDPGVANTFWLAGEAAGNTQWKEDATRIMRNAARRRMDDSGIVDASFCHGSAGVAHIFHQFYRRTGLPEFRAAAEYWYNILAHHKEHQDAEGLWRYWGGPEEQWQADPTLLQGLAGIGLSLISAASSEPPAWERCFLLS